MNRARRLRGTSFSVDHDYPREIKEARTRLWPMYKDLKNQNPRSKVQILYPAKLIRDGHVVRDELPDWGKYMGTNRLAQVHQIVKVKPQYVRKPTASVADTPLTNQAVPQQSADHSTDLSMPTTVSLGGAQEVPFGSGSSENAILLSQGSGIIHRVSEPMEQNYSAPCVDTVMPVTPRATAGSTTTLPPSQSDSLTTLTPSQITEMEIVIPDTVSGLPTVSSSISSSLSEKPQNVNVCGKEGGVMPAKSDETSVKVIQSDQTNPLLSSDLDSRGRTRTVKSAARSERRSQSAVPYKRQSVSRSRSRATTNRVLPGAKNNISTPQINPALTVDLSDSSQRAELTDATSTGQPPTHSERVNN